MLLEEALLTYLRTYLLTNLGGQVLLEEAAAVAWHDKHVKHRCAGCGGSVVVDDRVQGGERSGGALHRQPMDEWTRFCEPCIQDGAARAHDESLLGRCLCHLALDRGGGAEGEGNAGHIDAAGDGGDGGDGGGDGCTTELRLALALVVRCFDGTTSQRERRCAQLRSLQATSAGPAAAEPEPAWMMAVAEHAVALARIIALATGEAPDAEAPDAEAPDAEALDAEALDALATGEAPDAEVLAEHALRAVETNAFAVVDEAGRRLGEALFHTAAALNHCCSGGNAHFVVAVGGLEASPQARSQAEAAGSGTSMVAGEGATTRRRAAAHIVCTGTCAGPRTQTTDMLPPLSPVLLSPLSLTSSDSSLTAGGSAAPVELP